MIWLAALVTLEGILAADGVASRTENDPPLVRLVGYYDRMLDLPRPYEKEPARLAEQVRIVQAWRGEPYGLGQ